MTIELSRDYLQRASQARTLSPEAVEQKRLRDQLQTEETLLENEKAALRLQELKNQRLEVSLQVFRAKEKESELIKEMRDFQARVQFCKHCGFWFNLVVNTLGKKVLPRGERVSSRKQFCDENIGDPDCVADRKATKERTAKEMKGAVHHGSQQQASTPGTQERLPAERVQHPPYVY